MPAPQPIPVEDLGFTFPAGWSAQKFDDWVFYREHFGKQNNGIKAVDLLAVSRTRHAYLIEVKDYRHPSAEKPSQLADKIAGKVMHSLAALLPAKLRANQAEERDLAAAALRCTALHVVAHIEQSAAHPPRVDIADLKQALCKKLRAIDPHVKVVSSTKMQGLPWVVS